MRITGPYLILVLGLSVLAGCQSGKPADSSSPPGQPPAPPATATASAQPTTGAPQQPSGSSSAAVKLASHSTTTKAIAAARKPTMIKLADGLQYEDTVLGTGAVAKTGDTVSVNYTGSLTDGTVFDSNVDPKFGHVQPFQFSVGGGMVIKGWDEGVAGMKVGGTRKLIIPANLAYGATPPTGAIPPNATLDFTVTLTSIQ